MHFDSKCNFSLEDPHPVGQTTKNHFIEQPPSWHWKLIQVF